MAATGILVSPLGTMSGEHVLATCSIPLKIGVERRPFLIKSSPANVPRDTPRVEHVLVLDVPVLSSLGMTTNHISEQGTTVARILSENAWEWSPSANVGWMRSEKRNRPLFFAVTEIWKLILQPILGSPNQPSKDGSVDRVELN